ncbi:MAG: toll/interleukin-1 receptor domain-containing protein [Bryobacterales bacterium]|nr:toll/interleukin-1 receptor domain-containing protein [Bryobacterales bacterium]MBV9400892.1 toll/interleukin-1 receptor domain-containing protein [Bryobacterales bacterium]
MVVYLSHSRQNASLANKLYDALQRRQLKPWLDSRELEIGADWNQQVASAIRQADAIVFLLGPPDGPGDPFQKFESEQVVDEEAYLDPSKPLIPVVIGEAKLPGFLRPRKSIHVAPTSIDFEALADSIAGALSSPGSTVDPAQLERGRKAREEALRNLQEYSRELAEQEAKRAGLRGLKEPCPRRMRSPYS